MSGNRHWTDDEVQYLKENSDKPLNFLAAELSRSRWAVAWKLGDLGLTSKKADQYTDEEFLFIKQNLGKMTISAIADELGRSQSGVSKLIAKKLVRNERKRKKAFLTNIESHVVPFYSKTDTYREIFMAMNVNDSFLFPALELQLVMNVKYEIIQHFLNEKSQQRVFSYRKSHIENGVEFKRMWRLL